MAFQGSCHCGGIAYHVDADIPTKAMECNCSICRRRGSLLAFFPADLFRLDSPRENVATYTFNKHVLQHHFCATCGCAPYAEGKDPKGIATVAINLRCADDVDLLGLAISHFDGASM